MKEVAKFLVKFIIGFLIAMIIFWGINETAIVLAAWMSKLSQVFVGWFF